MGWSRMGRSFEVKEVIVRVGGNVIYLSDDKGGEIMVHKAGAYVQGKFAIA